MKKLIYGVLAVAAPIALSTASASAATTNVDGSTAVTKGEIQAASAFKWNNGDFDSHVVKGGAGGKDITFTTNWTKTYDNVLTCGPNADNKVVHVPVTSTGKSTLNAVQTLSSNGKQVSGWTLTGGVDATGSNDLNKVMQATFTACLPDKPYTEMTPEELRRLPVKVETPTDGTVTVGDLTAISNTGESHALSLTPAA